MHPEDRVLVAVMNRPQDFEIARDQGWYRVPEQKTSRGVYFEYVAFYFTGAFGEQGWAVHHYARRLGHELATRRELLPNEPDHPRAGERDRVRNAGNSTWTLVISDFNQHGACPAVSGGVWSE